MTHQPLIASYRKDFPWLFHLLRSMQLNLKGFLPPTVVVPAADRFDAVKLCREAHPKTEVVVSEVPPTHRDKVWCHFMRAQIAMLSGDIHCPDADIVWLFGSDCFISGEIHPDDQMLHGKPIMLYSSYEWIQKHHTNALCWRSGTDRALATKSEHEFMRRLPLLYPRSLYPQVRARVAEVAGMPFLDAVYSVHGPKRDFSESNILGTYAWENARHLYHWVNIDANPPVPKTNVIQFWSHGGMDKPCDIHSPFCGITPRSVMDSLYVSFKRRAAESG